MKEPKNHYEYEDPDYGLEGICAKDGEKWPCPSWKKWIKSPDYRFQVLEEDVERLRLDSAGNRKELRILRESHRRLDLFVRAGLRLLVKDIAEGRPAGVLTEKVHTDYQEFHTYGSSQPIRVAGAEEYTVTYEGPHYSGKQHTWTNGHVETTFGPH